MFLVFGRVLSIFMLILVGFIANKVKLLPDTARPHLINLMMSITAPCMAAESIYSKELSPDVIESTVQVIIGATVYFVVMNVFCYFAVRLLRFKPKAEWGMFIVGMVGINTGFMGFPITKAIFGDGLFYLMVMHNVALCIYLYTISPAVMQVGRAGGEAQGGGIKALKAIINPCTIGIICGFVFLLAGYRPPDAINEVVTSLSEATIPLSMIIVGVQLGSSNIKEMIKNKYINIATVITMVIMPILTFLVVDQLDFLNTDVKCIMTFASAFPTAVVTAAIAEKEGLGGNRLAELVSFTTLVSLVTIPIFASFLMSYYY